MKNILSVLSAIIAACAGYVGIVCVINGKYKAALPLPNGEWLTFDNIFVTTVDAGRSFVEAQLPLFNQKLFIFQLALVSPAAFNAMIEGKIYPKNIISWTKGVTDQLYAGYILSFVCWLFGTYENGKVQNARFVPCADNANVMALNALINGRNVTLCTTSVDLTNNALVNTVFTPEFFELCDVNNPENLWVKSSAQHHPYSKLINAFGLSQGAMVKQAAKHLKPESKSNEFKYTAPTPSYEEFDMSDAETVTEPPVTPPALPKPPSFKKQG